MMCFQIEGSNPDLAMPVDLCADGRYTLTCPEGHVGVTATKEHMFFGPIRRKSQYRTFRGDFSETQQYCQVVIAASTQSRQNSENASTLLAPKLALRRRE
jgi:hypothetical protein